jgi:hypothetical protein
MSHSQRSPGSNPPRQSSSRLNAEEQESRTSNRKNRAGEERQIERARYRNSALRGGMEEGDEGQGEWESSARSW